MLAFLDFCGLVSLDQLTMCKTYFSASWGPESCTRLAMSCKDSVRKVCRQTETDISTPDQASIASCNYIFFFIYQVSAIGSLTSKQLTISQWFLIKHIKCIGYGYYLVTKYIVKPFGRQGLLPVYIQKILYSVNMIQQSGDIIEFPSNKVQKTKKAQDVAPDICRKTFNIICGYSHFIMQPLTKNATLRKDSDLCSHFCLVQVSKNE